MIVRVLTKHLSPLRKRANDAAAVHMDPALVKYASKSAPRNVLQFALAKLPRLRHVRPPTRVLPMDTENRLDLIFVHYGHSWPSGVYWLEVGRKCFRLCRNPPIPQTVSALESTITNKRRLQGKWDMRAKLRGDTVAER